MSKFKFEIGDSVRVINENHKDFDDVGVIRELISSMSGRSYEVAFSDWRRPTFHEHELTLADPDVRTVLDQMDAESAPKLPAFMVGERVMVVDTVGDCGGRSGVVTGSEDFEGGDWLVKLDGNDEPIPFMTSELSRNRNPFKDMAEQEIDGDYVRGLAAAEFGTPCLTAEQWEAAIKPDPVNHPAHYGGDTTYEVIKVIEAWGLGFSIGNCVKYLSRAGKKGPVLEDLRKARFYLDREIDRAEAAQ